MAERYSQWSILSMKTDEMSMFDVDWPGVNSNLQLFDLQYLDSVNPQPEYQGISSLFLLCSLPLKIYLTPVSTSQMSSTSFPSPETWLKSGSGLGPAPSYHLPLNANLAWKNIWNFNQWCSNEIRRAPLGRRGALLFVISFFLSLGTSSSVCAVNEMLLLLWWHIVHQWQWAMWEEPELLWCG